MHESAKTGKIKARHRLSSGVFEADCEQGEVPGNCVRMAEFSDDAVPVRQSRPMKRQTARSEIEAHLHADVLTLLTKELPLGGEAVVGDEADTDVVSITGGERHPQLGRGAHPPLGGRVGLDEEAGNRAH